MNDVKEPLLPPATDLGKPSTSAENFKKISVSNRFHVSFFYQSIVLYVGLKNLKSGCFIIGLLLL